MAIWITRSAPDNLRTARELHALGFDILMMPVLATVAAVQPPDPTRPDAIVFTSVHAVRNYAWHDQMAQVPVLVPSGTIAQAASAAGYTSVTSIDEAILVDLLVHVLPPAGRVLIICGANTSTALADKLQAMRYRVERLVAYHPDRPEDHAIDSMVDHLGRITAITVHSRSSAERIVPVLRDARWIGSLWCISEQSARLCSVLPGVSVATAGKPSEAALLKMIAGLAARRPRRTPGPSRKNVDFMRLALRKPSGPRGVPDRDGAD